jgi:hypothetical protein
MTRFERGCMQAAYITNLAASTLSEELGLHCGTFGTGVETQRLFHLADHSSAF